jgi:hypothetical protein
MIVSDIKPIDWRMSMGDVRSLLVLTVVTSIPILGWLFAFKAGVELLAVSIRRKRVIVFLLAVLAALPVTTGMALLLQAIGLVDFGYSGPFLSIIIFATPVAFWLVALSAMAVEYSRAKRAEQLEVAR